MKSNDMKPAIHLNMSSAFSRGLFRMAAWGAAGGIGALVFFVLYAQVFPLAGIPMRIDRRQAYERAQEFVRAQGFDTHGYSHAVYLTGDSSAQAFVQKTLGTAGANSVSNTAVPRWFWQVRWFKELQKEGFFVYVDPATGAVIFFQHRVLEDAPGSFLDKESALARAQTFAVSCGYDLAEYTLKEQAGKQQKFRSDYFFEWEQKNSHIGAAATRLMVTLWGDTLGEIGVYFKVPEEFLRALRKEMSWGNVFAYVPQMFLFFLTLAAIALTASCLKASAFQWKLGVACGVSVAVVHFALFVNAIPIMWNFYADTESIPLFFVMRASDTCMTSVGLGALVFAYIVLGAFWQKRALVIRREHSTYEKIIVSWSLAGIFLGYITLFYIGAGRVAQVWTMPQALYSNAMAAYIPFAAVIGGAVLAAFLEEAMFRLFSVSLLRGISSRAWIAIAVSAVVWGFAHSTYAIFPVYLRGIELTIFGVVLALVFIRYGWAVVIAAHLVINTVLASMPFFQAHTPALFFSGIAALGCAALLSVICVKKIF